MLFGKEVFAIQALQQHLRAPCTASKLALFWPFLRIYGARFEETGEVALVVVLGHVGNRASGGGRGCSARLLAPQDELAGAGARPLLSSLLGLRNQAIIR